MKKRKSIFMLIPSLLGVAIFSSISVGVTFALFTKSSQTEIRISSGKISLVPSLREYDPVGNVKPLLKTYSAVEDSTGPLVDENGQHYHYEEQGFYADGGNIYYNFSEGGFATYSANPGIISLTNMIPGDKVKFQFDIVNNSNIAIKYRFTFKVVDPNNNGDDAYVLASGLHTDFIVGTTEQIDGGTATVTSYDSLKEYGSDWQVLAPQVSPDSVGMEISLPIDKGNIYQNKTSIILITFESIQGNATTENNPPIFIG